MNFTRTTEATSYVKIDMEDGGSMVAFLDDNAAPKTCANFRELVGKGFYNGLIFHRVIPGFVIQGGDPLGNGTGGSEKKIVGEFIQNGFKNDLAHTKGVLSMARTSDPNSATSQFFICLGDVPYLDGQYAAFGKLVEGEETLDKIASVQTLFYNDKPIVPQKMKEVYFVTEK